MLTTEQAAGLASAHPSFTGRNMLGRVRLHKSSSPSPPNSPSYNRSQKSPSSAPLAQKFSGTHFLFMHSVF